MNKQLLDYVKRPPLYERSPSFFWTDKHISKNLLEAHLDPDYEAASRHPRFVSESVDWISSIAPCNQYPKLLDIGCGPGLYAQRFHEKGYSVTGIDFSENSLLYAREQAKLKNSNIEYLHQDYLSIDYSEVFDVVTLIYCDYGALSTEDRIHLLKKVYKALKPNGKFILDVFTGNQYKDKEEEFKWEYHSDGGFWSDKPHLYLDSFCRYDQDDTILIQVVVVNENTTNYYNIWEHYFSESSLKSEIKEGGFSKVELFGDISGKEYNSDGKTMCVVLTK